MLTRSFLDAEESKNFLAYTPMLHARLFAETSSFRDHHFQARKSGLEKATPQDAAVSDPYLDGNPSLDRPLVVQFCANSPEKLLEAARYVQAHCDAVDLNLGCPQGIAKRGNYGAFLQEDWALIHDLIRKLHDHLEVPVTAKIRVLETKERTLEYARMVVSAGASILTIHGRQRHQKGHETGLADWSVIRHLRDNLPSETVIFANGNILRRNDLFECLEETGADGIMSAEGNLFDPSIFAKPPPAGQEGREYWRGRNGLGGYRVDAVFRRYMDIMYRHVLEKSLPERAPLFVPGDTPQSPQVQNVQDDRSHQEEDASRRARKRRKRDEKLDSPNILGMQAHLFHLLRTFVNEHTDIRIALGRTKGGGAEAYEPILSMVEERVREGLLDYEADPDKYDKPVVKNVPGDGTKVNIRNEESFVAAVAACRRPWWVCQSYVRPLLQEALEKGSITISKRMRKELEEAGKPSISKAKATDSSSTREHLDQLDGMPPEEMPKETTVCG